MLRHGKISYKIEKKEEKSYGKNFFNPFNDFYFYHGYFTDIKVSYKTLKARF